MPTNQTATINGTEIVLTRDEYSTDFTILWIGGKALGLLRKIRNTRTERFPFQALLIDGAKVREPNTIVASCFPHDYSGPRAARKAALEALVAAIVTHPNPEVLGPSF